MADLAVWQRTIVDETGLVVPGAEIEVRHAESGALAQLYQDREGTQTLSNPVAADMSGFVRFFIEGGAYDITATGSGASRTWRFDATGRLKEFDKVVAEVITDDAGEQADIRDKIGAVARDANLSDLTDAGEARANLGTFPSVSEVENSHIPAVIDSIRTDGYYEPGDGGGAQYARGSETAGAIRSADGAWWVLVPAGDLDARQLGLSFDQTPAERREALQDAIDLATELGVWLYIPEGTWALGTVPYNDRGVDTYACLQYHTGSRIRGAGIDKTILVFSEDAHEDANLLEPSSKDPAVQNWAVHEMTLDGNWERSQVVAGNNRPGSSCMATMGSQYGHIHNMRFTRGMLHCLDICNAGEIGDGRRWYAVPANRSETHYPGPLSHNIVLSGEIHADGGGDDNITGHYSHDIFVIGQIISHDVGARHSGGVHVSNAVELDDGCFRWFINQIRAEKVSRGFVVKCHSPEPAPHDIVVNQVVAKRCHTGVMIRDPGYPGGGAPIRNSARNVQIGVVHVIEPEPFAGPGGGDPTGTDRNAVDVRSYKDVVIGQIIAEAADDEEGLNPAIIIRSSSTGINIGNAAVRNWPWDEDDDSSNSTIYITGSCSDIVIGHVDLQGCGYRGIVNNGAERVVLGGGVIRGTGVGGSVGIRWSSHPSDIGGVIGPFTIDGFASPTSFGSQTPTGSPSFHPGDIMASGLLKVGRPHLTTARNEISLPSATSSGDEVLQIRGSRFLASFYERGAGGGGGASAANTILELGYADTNRSINAGGTINASGADYAEYRYLKPHLYGTVPKGALLGEAGDGLLTDRWSEVVGRIYVKSTAPNLVGGDTWGHEDRICAVYGVEAPGDEPEIKLPPEPPEDADESTLAAYRQAIAEAEQAHVEVLQAWQDRKVAFEAALEAERAKVDRIAMCGLAPVNIDGITEADLGKYLVPQEGPGDTITAAAVAEADLTLAQYIRALGVVVAIEPDGRPLVSVKVT